MPRLARLGLQPGRTASGPLTRSVCVAAARAVCVTAALGLCAGAARAQGVASIAASPLAGVAQPGAGIADGASVFAGSMSAASLADLASWQVGLRHTETTTDLAWSGRGTGVYFASPLPVVRSLKLGAGVELLRPVAAPLAGRLQLALAYQALPSLTVGLSYGHLFQGGEYDGLDTVDLSLRLRAGRHLALGAALHDLSAPVSRAATATTPAVQRSYQAELLVRPLGDDRFELGAGARIGEKTAEILPRLRLWVRPLDGLGLGAEASLLLPGPSAAATGGSAGPLDYRVGVGVELGFSHVGLLAHGLLGRGAPVGFHGGSVALQISGERQPALWDGPRALYRIELGARQGQDLLETLLLLRRIEHDRRALGVLVLLNEAPGGWGIADELHQALLRLRAAGKRVFAYGADLSTRELYIASAAERTFLDPLGSVRLLGIAQGVFYYHEGLDRLGIRAELVRVGEWKGTPETFTQTGPSDPVRAQRQALVDDVAAHVRDGIARGRGLTAQQVEALFGRGLFSPTAAKSARLVDDILSGEYLDGKLAELLGSAPSLIAPPPPARARSFEPRGIAIVQVDGDLTASRSLHLPIVNVRMTGGDAVLQALAETAADPRVRAIVIRVDSPGGSALWADLLARQVQLVRRHKPVICSFGDTAASGGYYLAAPCTEIFASPGTLTGSIGIFGGKVDFSGLLAKVGVHRATFERGPHADMDSLFRPYTEAERALLSERLHEGYRRFVEVVAQGRRLSAADVDKLARGRVFTGAQAHGLRLVDRLGGLADAVARARELAGLSPEARSSLDGDVFYYPRRPRSLLRSLLGVPTDLFSQGAAAGAAAGPWAALLGQALQLVPPSLLALLVDGDEVLMRAEEPPLR
ncbi:MAG: signal peptide peptidase SppA [Polyangia bacterium]